MRRGATAVIVMLAAFATVAPAAFADTVSPLNISIDFNEYPFPAPTQVLQGPDGTSSVSYNLFDDGTGEKLAADNGDLPDVTFVYTTSAPGDLGTVGRPSIEINPTANNQLTGRTGFTDPPTSNNPGTRQFYTIEVHFADHLDITDVTIDTNSVNTAGTTWEFTVVSFLDPTGALFSPVPTVAPYLDFEPGLTGPSGIGHFLAAETGTVVGVGTDQTSAGTSGEGDQVDDTISTSDVNLPAGASIGGFVFTTTLEDVAGVNNGPTAFSSSIRRIDIEGTITQVAAEADVEVSMTGSVDDDQVSYEITVTNDGPDPATGVVVTDEIPAELEYVSDDCGGTSTSTWTWDIGDLAAGSTATCTLVTSIVVRGPTENVATVTADQDDPNPGNNSATVRLDTTTEPTPTTAPPTTTAPTTTAPTTPAPTTTTAITPVLPPTGTAIGYSTFVATALLLVGLLLVTKTRLRHRD